ncbi:M48 family metallopeptidase [Micromonospora narathiwatensis]|uniref:Zn-dependent protease with chaperone function n=1 Tax=Micromonospora narathiwatensis TaxID=299146 RepID=A0A1A9A4L3_9ACTN|nr:M48 family metallopeptidase [Micromonospora narathiwatensis]SBT51038.1 Zn-dependent protease with chaperone function [Micromonospora narathiwatensis]
MSATYRALASVVMLIGFYVVALLQLAAVAALGVWLFSHTSGLLTGKVLLPLVVALGAVAVGLWKAIRTKNEPLPGPILGEREAPQLWATVRELAAAVGTRAPDEIRLLPDVNAAVSEQSRLLGLLGGRRTLYVGLPLLQGLRVDQLRSVLAHELGHYSGRHTRLGGVAYRGRLAIEETVERISPRNPIGWVFKGYALLYLMVDNAASRRQELEADRASVRLAGHEAATSALRTLPALDAAWAFYMRQYVEAGWSAGLLPDDLFGGFAQLLDARRNEIDELRENAPERKPSRWDTHPPIGVRVAAMVETPAATEARPDDRPASIVLADVAGAGRQLQSLVVEHGSRRILPWPEFVAEWMAASTQQRADGIYRAAGRFTGTATSGLPTVLDLVRAGRLGEFAAQFFPDATSQEAATAFAGPMETLLDNASIRSGRARWQLSWSGPARLVGPAGEPWDLAEIAKLAVSPETLDEALARLAERGVDPAQATVVQARASARNADLIGGLANIKIDGREHDVLVLDNGLVLIPDPGKSSEGEKRLTALVGAEPVGEVAARYPYLPYEEITSVEVRREVPLKATLTLFDGRVVQVQELMASEFLEKHSRDTLLRVFERIKD